MAKIYRANLVLRNSQEEICKDNRKNMKIQSELILSLLDL